MPTPARTTARPAQDRLVLFVDGQFFTMRCKKHPEYRGEKRAPRGCGVCGVLRALRRAAAVTRPVEPER